MDGKWWRICLALILPMSACGYNPTDKEDVTVNEMTTGMRTWGMGRHLIELPPTWRCVSGSEVTLYYGLGSDFETVDVMIVGQTVSQERFDESINARALRISHVKHSTQVPMLNFQSRLHGTATLLSFYKHKELPSTRTHELHILVGDVYVLIRADSYNGVISPVESRLKELATQIDKVIVPERVGAGFVLGPIIIRSAHDHESATLYYYDSKRRDVGIEVGISAVTPDEGLKLHQRFPRDMDAFGVPQGAILRERDISIAGMRAEEALLGYDASAPDDKNPRRELLFVAESYRSNPGFMWPTFAVRMTTGGNRAREDYEPGPAELAMFDIPSFARPFGYDSEPDREEPIPSSLTDHEAMGVWDAVLKSVHPRSGAVARPPERVSSVYIDPAEREAQKRWLEAWLAEVPDSEEGQTVPRQAPPAPGRVATAYNREEDIRSLIALLNSRPRSPDNS